MKELTEKEARAAQFAAYSPLKGYYDLILQKKKINDNKNDMPKYQKTDWDKPSLD